MTADPFLAYEMLGSAAEAEDVVQDSWLRWAGVNRSQVRDPRAYLIRVVARQALNPIYGAEPVARLLARANRAPAALETTIMWLNGAPAGRIEIDGERTAVSVVVENGRFTRIYLMRNPRKLTRLDQPAELAR